MRISMADIASDGPFSVFPGVERWFAVVTGAGVVLAFDGKECIAKAGDAPLSFSGAAAPDCRLIEGPTRDLNLVAKGGRSAMRAVAPGADWSEEFEIRGLFTATPGRWSGEGTSHALPKHALLWKDGAQAGGWRFSPDDQSAVGVGWWLGFTS